MAGAKYPKLDERIDFFASGNKDKGSGIVDGHAFNIWGQIRGHGPCGGKFGNDVPKHHAIFTMQTARGLFKPTQPDGSEPKLDKAKAKQLQQTNFLDFHPPTTVEECEFGTNGDATGCASWQPVAADEIVDVLVMNTHASVVVDVDSKRPSILGTPTDRGCGKSPGSSMGVFIRGAWTKMRFVVRLGLRSSRSAWGQQRGACARERTFPDRNFAKVPSLSITNNFLKRFPIANLLRYRLTIYGRSSCWSALGHERYNGHDSSSADDHTPTKESVDAGRLFLGEAGLFPFSEDAGDSISNPYRFGKQFGENEFADAAMTCNPGSHLWNQQVVDTSRCRDEGGDIDCLASQFEGKGGKAYVGKRQATIEQRRRYHTFSGAQRQYVEDAGMSIGVSCATLGDLPGDDTDTRWTFDQIEILV